MPTIRLTMAQALVRHLVAQRIATPDGEQPLFAGVMAIFGHGNVVALGEALHAAREALPVWRGQNEQSMALAAVAFAKAARRRRIMVATSSIGPGATNMITAAAVAHVNRLPTLFLPGDIFAHRHVDPALQQIEVFGNPTVTANDCFIPVSRFWDRIGRPEQIMASLPAAIATMLDPADCGPATLCLPQDVQGEAYDYPESFFAPRLHTIRRIRPDRAELAAAAQALRGARRPLIIAGGGAHYALALDELAGFAERHGIPVAETQAGRASLPHAHPLNMGTIGAIGSDAANALAAEADLVLAVGTRLSDVTTGSWSVFQDPSLRIVALNAARFDATKRACMPLVADALEGLAELGAALAGWRAEESWRARATAARAAWDSRIDQVTRPSNAGLPSYAQVIGALNAALRPGDVTVAAAGGLPGELSRALRPVEPGSHDMEYGFSCMGYEIAGALGRKMAEPGREVIVLTGDGSYLMLNSEIVTSVLTGHKLIVIVCDNAGFACINRLQLSTGNAEFNNQYATCRGEGEVRIDFVQHAQSLGAGGERIARAEELGAALDRARASPRTYVIQIDTDAYAWNTAGGAWWEVGVPAVSPRTEVLASRDDWAEKRRRQRVA